MNNWKKHPKNNEIMKASTPIQFVKHQTKGKEHGNLTLLTRNCS